MDIMGKNKIVTVLYIIILAVLFSVNIVAQDLDIKNESYVWKNVQMIGGGFVDGIIFHPTAKGVRYCRTDMGGAYRWNNEIKKWEPMLDWVSYEDVNLMGVESIALDPSDPDKLYLACGTYTMDKIPNGAILRSNDRGKTFQRTNLPFKMGGNENGRGNGERMAVDPNNGHIIYLGTRLNGLWKSIDGGITWNKVESFPDVIESNSANKHVNDSLKRLSWKNSGCGIIFVLFDPKSGSAQKESSVIYAGVSFMNRENFFRSNDAGKTWQPVPGQPTQFRPTHGVMASDGTIYISYGTSPGPSRMTNGGVWKLNTSDNMWVDITPDKPNPEKRKAFGYAAVALDANNPRVIIASSFGRPDSMGGEDIFRSIDGGKTWKTVFGGGGTFDYSLAPYVARTRIHWLFDIEIDPADPNHAMFTTGYGGHETFNLTNVDDNKPTTWGIMTTGVEETVALELLSPPKGANLITAIGDYGGFVHWDLDKPSPEGNFDNPHFGNTNGVACAENNPGIIVRVGRPTGKNPGRSIGYSSDGGKNWQPAVTPNSGCRLGHIAVSSDGATWIWAPEKSPVYFSKDNGITWTQCKGLPENIRVIADRVNADKFYALALFDGKLFISNDGGVNFIENLLNLPGGLPKPGNDRGDWRGGQDRIYATPGREGDIWIAAFDGLYHSIDTGKHFIRLYKVKEIHAFGYGKAAPDSDYPALYLIGVINGIRGIFRSDDTAHRWVRINDDAHQWGLLLHITGDPKKYGRVYVGTHGRGTVYGDPVE
jgi:photosystem II stability/assembly factor-like uncharacterized protein